MKVGAHVKVTKPSVYGHMGLVEQVRENGDLYVRLYRLGRYRWYHADEVVELATNPRS